MTAADVDDLRAAGLSDAAIVHVVVQSAFFNYLNRVADGVGIDFDYESPLPRMEKDATLEPVRATSTFGNPVTALRLADRPGTAEAFARWRAYLLDGRRERQVIAAAVAAELGDASVAAADPASPLEHALAAYAITLTSAPWQLSASSLAPLRGFGLDDRAILDVIAVASCQNTVSRIARVLVI